MDKIRQLLDKYLDGTCTVEEQEQVKQLLDQPDTEDLLHGLMEKRAGHYETVIPDAALTEKVNMWENQVMLRIDTADAQHTPVRMSFRKRLSFLRHAAIWTGFLVLGTLAVWQYRINNTEQITFVDYTNKDSFPVRYVLPDSSEVFLGAGSSLHYPKQFNTERREVRLSGDAFFDIQPDVQRPFTVQTGTLLTRVLGTSFKIEAHHGQSMVVSVATGRVAVSDTINGECKELAVLTPGKKLDYNASAHIALRGQVDIDGLLQWTKGDLVYDEQPLWRVMRDLEKRYNIKVTFADAGIETYKVSGSFERGQDVRSMMAMLGVIGKFRYTFNSNQSVQLYK